MRRQKPTSPQISEPLRADARAYARAHLKPENSETNSQPKKGRGRPVGALEITTKGFIAKALKNGKLMSPLEYMMTVMSNPAFDVDTRLKAAANAAPYIHHKLVAQTLDVNVVAETQDQRMARLTTLVLEAENDDLMIEGHVEAAE